MHLLVEGLDPFNEAATFRPRNPVRERFGSGKSFSFNEAATFRPRNPLAARRGRGSRVPFNEAATFRPRNHVENLFHVLHDTGLQ